MHIAFDARIETDALVMGDDSELREVLSQSLQAIIAGVSLSHPSFKQVALELSPEGAAKLGVA